MLHHMIEKTMADNPLSDERRQLIDQMRAQMRWSLLPEKGKYQTFFVSQNNARTTELYVRSHDAAVAALRPYLVQDY